MQKLILLMLVIQSVLAISCETRVGRYDSFQRKLDEVKSTFPDSLLSHFPVQMEYPANYTHSEDDEKTNKSLLLEQEYDNEELGKLQKHWRQKSRAIYGASDSCLFVVNRFARTTSKGDLFNQYSSSMDRPSICSDGYLPVPNFWQFSNSTLNTPSRLPVGFTIYVVDAEKGDIGDEIKQGWKRYLPDEWKNGYTKGVAVNEKENKVIYWAAMW